MRFYLHLLYVTFILLTVNQQVIAQDQKNTPMPLSALLDVMMKPVESISVSNKDIYVDIEELSKRYGVYNYLSSKYPRRVKDDRILISAAFTLKNCTFQEDISFSKLEFENGAYLEGNTFIDLSFNKSQGSELIISNSSAIHNLEVKSCEWNGLEISGNRADVGFSITDVTIKGNLKVENNNISNGEINVLDSKIVNGNFLLGDNEIVAARVEGCDIQLGEYSEFNHYKLPGKSSADLYLTGNTIYGDESSRIMFNKGNYLNLDIRDNKFDNNVYFVENNVHERFFLVNNTFSKHVSFEKFLFSEIWNELYWDQLKGHKLRYNDYGANSREDFNETIKFKNLINIYKDMHSIFLSRGDLESANACYSEMKELQGSMLKHIYRNHRTFGNLLRWQLNVLLRIYTNHGTDPGLAVVMSMYVILIFSMLYIFFPSEWDNDTRNKLLVDYEKLLHAKEKKYLSPLLVVFGSIMLTVVNAATLSINSFVTLGFGSIPTKGLARYLCIIEGFIGWFLLSIFTVSLINQVLA